ncbi:8630_t:CDS:2, partial [Entrophospora sp. SA101]
TFFVSYSSGGGNGDNSKSVNNGDNTSISKFAQNNQVDDPKSNISKYFNQCIEFIEKAKESNGRVYVHCYAGISRSTTVVIAYLMYSCRFSLKKALNLVREKHKIVRPNSGFIRQLEKFEKEISLKD